MKFEGRCYRGHDPQWAFAPMSGDGAALDGGRFNRKGQQALYLSLSIATAIGECTQGLARRMPPLTMCEYDVECEDIADLRTAAGCAAQAVSWDDLGCPWLKLRMAGLDVPSWLIVDHLVKTGYSGILVPSFVPGATGSDHNLVLWNWGPDLPHRVQVYDPSGRLPANRLSWPPRA